MFVNINGILRFNTNGSIIDAFSQAVRVITMMDNFLAKKSIFRRQQFFQHHFIDIGLTQISLIDPWFLLPNGNKFKRFFITELPTLLPACVANNDEGKYILAEQLFLSDASDYNLAEN